MKTWLKWEPRGRDPYTNPRSSVAHLGSLSGGPTECGRFIDTFDAVVWSDSYSRRCKRCERSQARRVLAASRGMTLDTSTARAVR